MKNWQTGGVEISDESLPDLYRACLDLTSWMYQTQNPGSLPVEYHRAMQALNKARGEKHNWQPSEQQGPGLLESCKRLIEYREKSGPLGFQLEKADTYIGWIENALRRVF